MTDQRELDRLLGAYFVEGTNELADRVIDAALDQIDHTQQRHTLRVPWRIPTMTTPFRLAAAAVIGVLAVGGALYLIQPGRNGVGGPGPSPSTAPSAIPSALASPVPTSAWHVTGSPAVDRGNSGIAIGLLDGRVLVVGGGIGPLKSAEVYDSRTGVWAATGSMHDARSYPIGVRLANDKVLVAGGNNGTTDLDTAELYDPATGVWTQTGPMTESRNQAFASLLSTGKVLVAGRGADDGVHETAELFDPASGTWTKTGSMTTGRAGPLGATLMHDGRLLVSGGFTDDPTSAEIYDPTTGKWTATAHMQHGRGDTQSSILLSNGMVIVSGGDDTRLLPTPNIMSDLFDPSTGTWTNTWNMTETYTDLVVLNQLADGKVLLVGGGGSRAGDVASGQLYDAATDTWSAIEALTQGRYVRSASLMPDGTVLVVTSSTTDADGQPRAEIYDPTP